MPCGRCEFLPLPHQIASCAVQTWFSGFLSHLDASYVTSWPSHPGWDAQHDTEQRAPLPSLGLQAFVMGTSVAVASVEALHQVAEVPFCPV